MLGGAILLAGLVVAAGIVVHLDRPRLRRAVRGAACRHGGDPHHRRPADLLLLVPAQHPRPPAPATDRECAPAAPCLACSRPAIALHRAALGDRRHASPSAGVLAARTAPPRTSSSPSRRPAGRCARSARALPAGTGLAAADDRHLDKPGPPLRIAVQAGDAAGCCGAGTLAAGWRQGVVDLPLGATTTRHGRARDVLHRQPRQRRGSPGRGRTLGARRTASRRRAARGARARSSTSSGEPLSPWSLASTMAEPHDVRRAALWLRSRRGSALAAPARRASARRCGRCSPRSRAGEELEAAWRVVAALPGARRSVALDRRCSTRCAGASSCRRFTCPTRPHHVAYTQYLAQTAKLPRGVAGRRRLAARSTARCDGAALLRRHRPRRRTAPPGTREERAQLAAVRRAGARGPAAGDVGSATNNPPLYYGVEAAAYGATPSNDLLDAVAAHADRLGRCSAALPRCSALLFVREVVPRRPLRVDRRRRCVDRDAAAVRLHGRRVNNDVGAERARRPRCCCCSSRVCGAAGVEPCRCGRARGSRSRGRARARATMIRALVVARVALSRCCVHVAAAAPDGRRRGGGRRRSCSCGRAPALRTRRGSAARRRDRPGGGRAAIAAALPSDVVGARPGAWAALVPVADLPRRRWPHVRPLSDDDWPAYTSS